MGTRKRTISAVDGASPASQAPAASADAGPQAAASPDVAKKAVAKKNVAKPAASAEGDVYDHRSLDSKWQTWWLDSDLNRTSVDRDRPKYYVLDMFPYPSGSGLHVGHPKGYVATDVVARAKRMMGYNVLRVMGWDSFGLPAERQAVKEDIHPAEVTARNVAYFKQQLQKLGLSYDWSREIATSDASYYKWTQWIFLQLYNKGLAYQAEVPVNWCPALGTVLANEEVSPDGKYVETGDPVERRVMKQWMLKITEYAERLLSGLDDVDWPEGIKAQQRDWIGKSYGAEVDFAIANAAELGVDGKITVFTTRPDTLYGGTYVVLAPEHELVTSLTRDAQRDDVDTYVDRVSKRSERDRLSQAVDADKTGVFTGSYAINPVTGKEIPIWIADYVLASYGTGAVFACPAHDERDHAFAKQFDLPIVEVVKGGNVDSEAYTGDGEHVNSDQLDGLRIADAKKKIITWLEGEGCGRGTINYKLRDWLFSRQRYWGEPFPMIETEAGEVKALPESALPVELPHVDEYKATADGRPPLARAEEWVKTTDPETGAAAVRETNTMPQWAGSCWYYLRFISPHSDDAAWEPDDERYWMPVDLYVGGAEHAVLHLLYARFWHHVLYDLGLVSTPEPFQRLFNQGMIRAMSYRDDNGKFYYPDQVEEKAGAYFAKSDGRKLNHRLMKMSKSRYNVVNPDDMCDDYGADAMRLYELFMGPLEDGIEWETSGVAGTRRFLDRLWRLRDKVRDTAEVNADIERALHSAIKKVSLSIESLRFNTAIADMMVFVNEATKADAIARGDYEAFIRILAPFAPHICEELWAALGNADSIVKAEWPTWDESKLKVSTVTLAVQVMGKLRGTIEVPVDVAQADAIQAAKDNPNVAKFLDGKTIRREIYVAGRLVNLVAN